MNMDFAHIEPKVNKILIRILLYILVSGKCYTDVLILPEPENISEDLFDDPEKFKEEIEQATIMAIHEYQESGMKALSCNQE